jgi:hypothetical protein
MKSVGRRSPTPLINYVSSDFNTHASPEGTPQKSSDKGEIVCGGAGFDLTAFSQLHRLHTVELYRSQVTDTGSDCYKSKLHSQQVKFEESAHTK